jgi:hypothetical protein
MTPLWASWPLSRSPPKQVIEGSDGARLAGIGRRHLFATGDSPLILFRREGLRKMSPLPELAGLVMAAHSAVVTAARIAATAIRVFLKKSVAAGLMLAEARQQLACAREGCDFRCL